MKILHEMHRDIHTGFMVGEMIKSGYYEEEFRCFGVAYWQNNDRQCLISSDESSIYSAVEQMMLDGMIVTPVEEILRRSKPDKTDNKQYFDALQNALKQKILETYPLEYFDVLKKYADQPNQNTAFSLLLDYRNMLLQNVTDYRWQVFIRLAQAAKTAKFLSADGYKMLLKDVDFTDPNLIPDEKVHRITGFSYLDSFNEWQYYINGYRPRTVEKKLVFFAKKVITTPIVEYQQDRENNHAGKISVIRKKFLAMLPTVFDKDFNIVLQQLQELPAAISKEKFSKSLKTIDPVCDPKALSSINGYRFLWHLV